MKQNQLLVQLEQLKAVVQIDSTLLESTQMTPSKSKKVPLQKSINLKLQFSAESSFVL